MPFKSYAQLAWLKHNKPGIFRRWAKKYGTKVKGNVQRIRAKIRRKKR